MSVRDRGGFALILALVVTAMLAAAALELTREAQLSADLAINFRDRVKARRAALDGLSAAAMTLIEDDPGADWLGEAWAQLGRETKARRGRSDGYAVSLTDEGGLIDLNNLLASQAQAASAWQRVMERVLVLLDRDPGLVQALLDWLDGDDEVRPGGGEAADYHDQPGRAKPRNGPLLDVRELALIKGFDRELLLGGADKPGLYDLVTVFGQARINVNTAPPLVLKALDEEIGDALIEEILELRAAEGLRRVSDLKGLTGMSEALFKRIEPLIEVKSRRFRVVSEGVAGRGRQVIEAVVERRDGVVKVVAGGVAR